MTEQDLSHNQSQDTQTSQMQVFDRNLVRLRRARAAENLGEYDFLHAHIAEDLSFRLMTVAREFPLAVEIGARSGAFAKTEAMDHIGNLFGMDLVAPTDRTAHRGFIVADEERLPLKQNTFDLAVSGMALHGVNDLPGALVQIRRALKPDGLFLGCLFGGDTLNELRASLTEAEAEVTGGASPHVSPFVDIREAGGLLQRAGFALPVADTDTITARYDSALHLMADLRGMGEANALTQRRRVPMRRAVISRALEIYQTRFADPDGRVRASFEIVYLSGWSPDSSQPQPLRPGSAKTRMADAFRVAEQKLKDEQD